MPSRDYRRSSFVASSELDMNTYEIRIVGPPGIILPLPGCDSIAGKEKNSLPTCNEFLASLAPKECPLCLAAYGSGEDPEFACELPCGHEVGRNCIQAWLEQPCFDQDRTKTQCPLCRHELCLAVRVESLSLAEVRDEFDAASDISEHDYGYENYDDELSVTDTDDMDDVTEQAIGEQVRFDREAARLNELRSLVGFLDDFDDEDRLVEVNEPEPQPQSSRPVGSKDTFDGKGFFANRWAAQGRPVNAGVEWYTWRRSA